MAAPAAELSKSSPPTTAPKTPATPAAEISLDEISPIGNIREVGGDELRDLVDSVKLHGVLEPVLLVSMSGYSAEHQARFDPKKVGYKFRVVAGFRRLAASAKAQRKTIPARVLDVPEREILEVQLVENLERKGLSVIEEASAFQGYVKTTGAAQADLAKRIGRDPSYVSNRIRLLALPKKVQELVDVGKLSASHAEVLLKLPGSDPEVVVNTALQVVREEVNVQDLNRSVTQYLRDLEEKRKLGEFLDRCKFANCPTCKARATARQGDTLSHGVYSTAHQWNPATGKTDLQRDQEEQAAYLRRLGRSRGSSSPPRERQRPKPVDCRESAHLRSAHDPHAIVQAILKQVGPRGIQLLEYAENHRSYGDEPGAVLRIGLSTLPLGEVHLIARPVGYSTGERTQFVVQDASGEHRKGSKTKVRDWERKALPALKLKPGKPAVFDAAQLKGTAGTVNGRLQKIRSNHELLELAREAESKGKHRAAVLDYIDEALLGRGHDSYHAGESRL